MPLSIPPGFMHVAIELRHALDPEPWYVTYGVDSSGAGGNIPVVGQNQLDAFDSTWGLHLSTQVQITGCQITVGQDGVEPIRAFVASGTLRQGNAVAEQLPQNCALLVRKNTDFGGRRNSGRCFLPGVLAENQVSSVGIIDAPDVGDLDATAALWLAALADVGGEPTPMVILHSTGITTMPDPTPVTSLTCDNVISTQRRRLR